ncbi:hypothetical protein [Streptomyces sp. NPDC050264]|uniref:hypothetical protein n=1 Tax=Streptomyces sp. NPDC050264 TaxID=3155038 RepID=UPI00344759AE
MAGEPRRAAPRARAAAARAGLAALTAARLVWDREDDEWFSDAPVLFDFDGEQGWRCDLFNALGEGPHA